MRKYTIVYTEYFQIGSHTNGITRCKQIECAMNPWKLTELGMEHMVSIAHSQINFIFDGWPNMVED